MEIFDGRYYKHSKWFLRAIGLWPYETHIRRINSFIIFYIIILSLAIPQTIMLVKHWRDFNIMCENSVSLMFAIVCMSKYAVTYTSAEQLKLLFLQIIKDWQKIKDETERKILQKTTEEGRTLVLMYTIYITYATIMYGLIPFTPYFLDQILPLQNGTRPKQVAFYADYVIFDQFDYHYWCCGHMILVYFYTSCSLFSGVDGIYLLAVKHACGLFLITWIETMGNSQKTDENCYQPKNDAIVRREMTEAVILHNETIRCVDLLEDSFSKCFLIVQGVSVLGLSLGSLYTLFILDDFYKFVRIVAFIFGIQIHLLYLNWVGQQIIDSSLKVFYSS
ncbi:hypothetical protein TSAR_009019 [Trichomalopsis sarcophagae]|uniref:Odorant receptor n=1 Tax=Trichomalopsis sarcophagae TaxID=543379 RepID=A0A232FAT4_9HYME|nr:hypothetical protein TSAR_009019 [Trichomalopsis sarcophagae]